jgi:hypothetical protein
MLRIALAAALLLGSAPAYAQSTTEPAAARTLEQNRRVFIGTGQSQSVQGRPPGQPTPAPQTAAPDRLPRPVALAQEGRAAR